MKTRSGREWKTVVAVARQVCKKVRKARSPVLPAPPTPRLTRSQTRGLALVTEPAPTRVVTRSQARLGLTPAPERPTMNLVLRAARVAARPVTRKPVLSFYATMRRKLARTQVPFTYLDKLGVLEWLYADAAFLRRLQSKEDGERNWGSRLIGYDTAFWTTNLGEGILNDLLLLRGETPTRADTAVRAANGKRVLPDWVTERGIYECKTRSYAAARGTAGEKALAAAVKYLQVPRLYNRPLYIVCLGYQQVEADRVFQLFNPKSEELKRQLDFWRESRIEFVKGTAMLEEALR